MGQQLYTNKQNQITSTDRSVDKSLSFSKKYLFDFSIIVPVYNSTDTLEKLTHLISDALKGYSYQIIFVNDKSMDNSWSKLESLYQENPEKFVAVNLEKNVGQHLALFCGMQMAKGEFVVTLDDDLQIPPKEILKIFDKIKSEKADLVYGVFPQKKHSKVRNAGSKFFGKIFSTYASTPRNGSSFKIINHSIVARIIEHNHHNVYIDELLGWYSSKTGFVEIEHNKRQEGNSGYSFISLVKLAINVFVNYTALPLKMITLLGLFSSLVSFLLGAYFLYQKFMIGAALGFTALIVSIFFSTGLILFSLGIIGEYISRLFLIHTGKPAFKIKKILN